MVRVFMNNEKKIGELNNYIRLLRSVLSRRERAAVFVFALLALMPFVCGCSCSCGGDSDFKKISHTASRTYEADAAREGFRVKSNMADKSDGLKYYGSGIDLMKRHERSRIIEKLQHDGRRALKNENFIEAERLFAEGKYEQALKYYNNAASYGGNVYIQRRALACKVSIDRLSVRENEDMKKASGLLIDGRESEALSLIEGLERREDAKNNLYFKQSISSLKIKAYERSGDKKKLIEEYIKQDNLSGELSETLSKAWTVPIEER